MKPSWSDTSYGEKAGKEDCYSHLRKLGAERISETDRFKQLAIQGGLDAKAMRTLSRSIKQKLSAIDFFKPNLEYQDLRQVEFQQRHPLDAPPTGHAWSAPSD